MSNTRELPRFSSCNSSPEAKKDLSTSTLTDPLSVSAAPCSAIAEFSFILLDASLVDSLGCSLYVEEVEDLYADEEAETMHPWMVEVYKVGLKVVTGHIVLGEGSEIEV